MISKFNNITKTLTAVQHHKYPIYPDENLVISNFKPAEQLYLGRSKQFRLTKVFKLRYEVIERKKEKFVS